MNLNRKNRLLLKPVTPIIRLHRAVAPHRKETST